MERRKILKYASALSIGSAFPLISLAAKKQFKLGLQLYSVNKDMNTAPFETLKALKTMGYEDFEIFGFDSKAYTYYGLKPKDLMSALSDMGLSVSSGHYGFSSYLSKPQDELLRFVDKCIQGAHALNSKYITWPWIAPEQRTLENYKLMADMLNVIGEKVTAAGLGFAYHNHGFEFDDHNGENGFDIITQGTDQALVKIQMDMYWVMHAGTTTPKQLVEQHLGRITMWHLKDMAGDTKDYTELGKGVIDYSNIMPTPEDSGLEYFYIEQGGNFAKSPMQSALTSAEYFNKKLTRFFN